MPLRHLSYLDHLQLNSKDPNCVDKNEHYCPKYAEMGLCDKNHWVFQNCLKSCENCDTSEGECHDMKSAEYCQKNKSHCHWGEMFWECRKTCNRCNDKPSCYFDKTSEKDIGNLG